MLKDALEDIAIGFDELGFEPTTLIDTTKVHFKDFFEIQYSIIEKGLEILEILKPLCEVVETPVKKIRYLKVKGVVVYTFKKKAEFDLFKEWLETA